MENGGEFMVDLDIQYQGSRYEAEWNLLEIESYMLADLRVSVSRGPWTVMAYVNNLLSTPPPFHGVLGGLLPEVT